MTKWLAAARGAKPARTKPTELTKPPEYTAPGKVKSVLSVLSEVASSEPGSASAEEYSAEDYREHYEERAASAEFDGGLSRKEAEALAYEYCQAAWLYHNPLRSPAGRCLGCGHNDRPENPLLPFGTETTCHAWLHYKCWKTWYAGRKAEAAAALAATGIHKGSKN